ncbi:MAG: GrpB family protein [Anaerolineales bacterium]|nr:GrpB family protein [Anaerolineales bacterium]
MAAQRLIEICPYDPAWAKEFAAEAERLTAVFGPQLAALHHIGSTAVPGLPAKPILDIMPVVHDITAVDALNPQMAGLGYIAKGENGVAGRRYFRKGSDAHHTHHVHVYQAGNPEIARHLDFRDYLRAHPEEAAAYGRLKTALAAQFRTDPPAYTSAKTAFVEAVLQKAAVWRQQDPVATL